MIQVKFGKDGFRRGRMDYKSTGVLRTKPGKKINLDYHYYQIIIINIY